MTMGGLIACGLVAGGLVVGVVIGWVCRGAWVYRS
jgi:hypothetical protein